MSPGSVSAVLGPGDLLVRSKIDLGPPAPAGRQMRRPPARLGSSAMTGEGLSALEALLAARVAEALGREEAPVLTRARHRRLVEEARAALQRAIPALDQGAGIGG